MKTNVLFRVGVAAAVAAGIASCDYPAPGLTSSTAANVESSVYSGAAAESAAPAPAATPAVSTPADTPPVATTPPAPQPPPPAAAPSAPSTPAATAATPAPAAREISGPTTVIKPVMPKPLFVGTPLPQTNAPPNLDKSGKPTLEVTVPEGAVLLSAGKEVTSDDNAPIGDLSVITDGDKDGDDGYFVDLKPGKTWVQIDLGESKEIWLIWVWHFHKQNVIFNDVVVQISDDPEFGTATTVFNNDYDNSSGFGVGEDLSYVETNNGRAMPVNGVKGRYVRLYSNGRDIDQTNQYIEVEVYGR